jgi:hypothetical protein
LVSVGAGECVSGTGVELVSAGNWSVETGVRVVIGNAGAERLVIGEGDKERLYSAYEAGEFEELKAGIVLVYAATV